MGVGTHDDGRGRFLFDLSGDAGDAAACSHGDDDGVEFSIALPKNFFGGSIVVR